MPDKYKKDLSIEVLVGMFMFVILIALGVFTIVLSRQNFLQKKYPVRVIFSEVGGLREGDNVFLRGTKVGIVKATYLENNHVIVESDLEVPVEFREGYKVEVVASSMLGGKLLKLYEGPLGAPALPPSTTIMGDEPIDILQELGDAVGEFKAMTRKVTAGEGTLGRLLSDDEMYKSLKTMVDNLNVISAKLSNGEGTIGKLIQDETIYNDVQKTVANLSDVSERLVNGKGTLGRLLSEDDALYADVSSAAANIREITEKIRSGEGTLGKLMEDDQMYVEAQKLFEELRAAIDDMRETSPVTTFSSVVFGAF
ncbi:MlaD family protein [Tichowtungia aerotolerans]|uniref:MCE family protein n=1 Tax=Tichowtungia aerotolerans TaxID=2697043 RepID=A0A6P1M6U9_9BACT|nr:MlaD family protein [Tichowtungia aerotolerans]QHI67928.1 MCE family protein [Tichowtungia aerotolerans]